MWKDASLLGHNYWSKLWSPGNDLHALGRAVSAKVAELKLHWTRRIPRRRADLPQNLRAQLVAGEQGEPPFQRPTEPGWLREQSAHAVAARRRSRLQAMQALLTADVADLELDVQEALVRMARWDYGVAARVTADAAVGRSKLAGVALAVVVKPRQALVEASKAEVESWHGAIDAELQQMLDKGVLAFVKPSAVDRMQDEVLPSLLVLTRKSDGRFKARLVACGNFQTALHTDTYASVADHSHWLATLTSATASGMEMALLDVSVAFLQTDDAGRATNQRTFLRAPSAFHLYDPMAKLVGEPADAGLLEVLKSIYGLATAPSAWKRTLTAYLRSIGFLPLNYDDCVLRRSHDGALVVLYVDDLMMFAPTRPELQALLDAVCGRFECTAPRFLSESSADAPLEFLAHGLWVQPGDDGAELHVSLSRYLATSITKLQEKGVFDDLAAISSLRPHAFAQEYLRDGDEPMTPSELTKFRAGLNNLTFAASGVRWDLLAATGTLGSGQTAGSSRRYLRTLQHLWAYVAGTLARHLVYSLPRSRAAPASVTLGAESDANFGSSRSRSGYFLKVQYADFVHATTGRSTRQSTVALSTAEAELTGLSTAARALVGFANFWGELWPDCTVTLEMHGDNVASVLIANNAASLRSVRHLCLQRLFVRELTREGRLRVLHVPGRDLAADLLTKVLPEGMLARLLWRINMRAMG